MKALSDYVHSRGMKFGMYSCAGNRTCAGFPGSLEHEFEDARTFAEWGVDFLKYDYCNVPVLVNGPILYNRMGMALKATGRDILFSACNWGRDNTEKWVRSTGAHMYRSTGDISDCFDRFKTLAMKQVDSLEHSAPGCFNDLDMLICGMNGKGNVANGGCTPNEYRTHFALWCIFQSPLMIGCDVRNIDNGTRELLLNKELIAINQDEEVRPPIRLDLDNRHPMALFKHLSNGEYLIGMFNLEDTDNNYAVLNFYDLGITTASGYGFRMREIFTGEQTDLEREYFVTTIPAHDCKLYRAVLTNE